ncbi:SIS domain-containing protein [Candidatus Pelagibacter sp.]|nr:SIS domain-containing protein [Candidatus Pelagibacter sp.]
MINKKLLRNKKNSFEIALEDSIKSKKNLLNIEDKVNLSIKKIYKSLRNKGKIFFCGNGGSAADAQHLAAELLIRLRPKVNRSPIPAISLCMDSSTLTACGNDYSFDEIFSRPFEALANKEDVLIVISTSGNSKNIIQVLKKAKKNKILSIGFLGSKGGIAKKYCDISLVVSGYSVARIQESHIFLGHFILESVENMLLKKQSSLYHS